MDETTRNTMFSSKTEMWETPQELFDKLDAEYHFDCDVCAIPENAKCKNYYTPEIDGYYPYCSICKNEPKSRIMTDYCPNCGAKMDGRG